MYKLAMIATLTAAALVAGADRAAADTCRNVDIRVKNSFRQDGAPIQIKAVDFDYWDDTEGKWRDEAFVGNLVILPGATEWFATNRNLSFVGGEHDVQIRVQFRYFTANNGWSELLDAYSEPFTCTTNRTGSLPITVEAK